MKLHLICILTLLFVLVGCILVIAQTRDPTAVANAGGLDTTFNLTGEKEIPISPINGPASHDQVNGIAVQSDGKIVLAGYVRTNINDSSSPEQIGVVRLNPDGSLDTGFGNSGIVITQAATAVNNPNSRGQAVAIQADGKIVVAGMANPNTQFSQQDFALVRYNVNGSLDMTFGAGGKVTGTFTSSGFTTVTAAASSLLIQPDGKIVAGGMAQNVPTGTDFALARYDSDGSLDTTFGTGGKVTTDFGSIAEQSTGIAFLTDQGQLKIVAVGAVAGGSTNHNFGVARYNANGTLDSTFGSGGKVVTSVDPSGADASSVAVASDGTIVVAGAGPNFTLARYDVHGALVPSLGNGGIVIRTMPGGAFPDAIAIQPDAKIIVSGSYGGVFGVERYAANGVLDTGFGTATLGPSDQICIPSPCTPPIPGANSFAMVLEPSTAKILIAGDSNVSGSHQTFVVARLLNDVSPRKVFSDFDGDRKADVARFRPADANWYELHSLDNSFSAVRFGLSTDAPVPGDFDGDGKTDIAVFRDGTWWILRSSDNQVMVVKFGQSGDIPRPGDFDGDGKSDIGIFRPSDGNWWYQTSSNAQVNVIHFGQNGDIPMIGDFDGDGKTDLTVFRPVEGLWYTLRSSDNQVKADQFGLNGDIPLNGDFNGDGKADLAVFRPSEGVWYIARPTGVPAQNFDSTKFGLSTDIPVPADYDGDGKTDIAIFRNGQWWITRSSAGTVGVISFGLSGDKPIASVYGP